MQNNATLDVRGQLLLESDVVFQNSGGILLGGDFDNRVDRLNYPDTVFESLNGRMVLNGSGTQMFEVAGEDFGSHVLGSGNNLAVGILEVASGSTGRFVNRFANNVSAEPCDEALNVTDLVLRGSVSDS